MDNTVLINFLQRFRYKFSFFLKVGQFEVVRLDGFYVLIKVIGLGLGQELGLG